MPVCCNTADHLTQVVFSGCGSEAGMGSALESSSASDKSSAYPNGGTGAADAGGGSYASDGASTQGGGSSNTSGPATGASDKDSGIGFKPGGAQDINYFRQLVAQGTVPAPTDMTIEGWLNEKDTKLPSASPDRTIVLHALAGVVKSAGMDTPDAVIQLGFNSAKSLAQVKAKVALTLVIDRSGSMKGDKLAYVKQGLHALLDSLPADTRLALVSFSSDVLTNWGPTVYDASSHKAELDAVIDALVAVGGTNLHGGLEAGAQHCMSAGAEYPFRRVILLSDGQPTAGVTNANLIIKLATDVKAKGVSVSTVGVGNGFNPTLMIGIAQQGDGTAWFLKDAAHAKDVFLNDLETMLLPVAKDLWIKFKLAKGWKVDKIYGFDWVEKEGEVIITGPSKGQDGGPTPVDPNEEPTDPDTGTPDEDKVALPTLFASKKNGMIMVSLLAPANVDGALVNGLLLSTISYGYTIAKVETKESFEVPVKVFGVIQIPDGGWAYFADPIVRRSYALLRAGLALLEATKTAGEGDKVSALAALDAALLVLDDQIKEVPESVDLAPGMPDAIDLLEDLKTLLDKLP